MAEELAAELTANEMTLPHPYAPACCCGAPWRVRVFLPRPDASDRAPDGEEAGELIDILLCEHHYRESAARLAEIGAIAIGNDGQEVGCAPAAAPSLAAERLHA